MTNYPNTTTKPSQYVRDQAAAAKDKELADWQIAAMISGASRADTNLFEAHQSARDRILKLSCEVWDLRQRIKELENQKLGKLVGDINGCIKQLEEIAPDTKLQYLEEFFNVSRSVRSALRKALENAGLTSKQKS